MSQPPATEGTAASQDSPPLPGLTLSPPSPTLPLASAPASPKEEDPSQRTVDGDPGRVRGQGSYSSPALDKTDEKSRKNAAESDNPRGKVSSEADSVDTTPTPRQGDPQGKDTVATPPLSSTKDTPKQLETQDPSTKSLPEDSSKRTEQEEVAPPERSPPEEDEDEMGNRLGGEKSKGKKGERKDGRKEERREEKRRRQGKAGDKKKSKCPADPDSLTTEIEDESSSFGFHSFENLLAGALGGSRSPKHRGGTSQASARDEDERDEVEWVPMSIEDEGGVQFKPDADDSSTASQGYSTPLLATPLMKRSQQQQQQPAAPPRSTAERLDQLGRAIQDTILSNLPDVHLPQERDSIALLGRADSLDGGSTDTLTLDDPTTSRDRGQARAAAGAAAVGDTDGRTSSTSSRIPGHVALDSRTNGSGSSTPVLRRRRDGGGSATSSPVLRRHNEGSSPSTPVLRRRNEGGGSATSSPVLRQRGNQGSAPGTPVLKQRSEAAAQAPRSPTLSPRHQAAGAGSPPPVPPHQGSSPSSPVLRQRSGGSGPDSPSLRHRNREPGSNSPVLPPRRQDSPSSPVPRRRNETSATGSPILRLKSQNSTPGSPVLRAKVQGSGANSPVLLRRQQEGSAPGSPTLRRNAGSASNSPVLRPRHQVMGPSALALSSGTQTPSTDSGLSTPASESRPMLQGSKGAGGAAPQGQVSSPSSPLPPGLAAEPPPPSPPPRTYPSNRPLPFPLDVDKLTDLPLKGAPAPSGLSHSLTRPATGPKEPMPPPECFHASLPRDSSRDSGLSLARAAPPPGDEEWMDEMFYSCQDVSFEKELRDDVVDGEQFLQPTPGPPHLAPPPPAAGDSLTVTSPASQARARGEKPKVVSQYDNVQDAEDAATAAPVIFPAAAAPTAAAPVPSVSPTSSSSSKMKSARGSKPAAGPFGIKEQKPSQTATTTTTPITGQQGLQQLSTSGKQAPASAAATSLGGGGGGGAQERSQPTVPRQDGATVSVEPPLQAVAMETASRAPPATAATTAREQPSQKEVTEHNLQLLVQAIEKLPHFDMAGTADVRDSLSMDEDSLAEAEESSPTDSSFEEARLRRVELKCVEVTCAAEKKKTPTQPPPPPPQEPAKQPQVSTVDLNVAQGGKESRKTTPAISARAKTSEKQVSRKEADTVAGKGEAGTGSPDTFVPPPSPSAMAELAEVEEEDEEDEEALERQEAAIQQQRALEARLFGDTVVKRLSSLLDSMGPAEESEPPPAAPPATAEPISSGDVPSSTPGHTTTTTTTTKSGSHPGPSSGGGPSGTATAAAVREVTVATISLGEVAGGGNPRPTTLPTAVAPGPGGASAAKCRAREAVVCSVASVQASRVQSEVVLESSPCVSPTSKPKSAGSVADGERSKGAEDGAFYITGTERQKSGEKTQDATKQQEVISSSHADASQREEQIQAAAVRDVQGCDSVADSKVNPHDEGEKENKKQDTGNQQQPDSSTQAGVVKKPSIPDLLITTAAEEAALAAEEAAEKLSAEHSHQEHVHPPSSTGTLVLFQIGESTHPDSGTADKTSGEKEGEKEPKTQGGGGGEEEKREEANRPAEESEDEGEATSPTTPVAPKRESQQIHDVISAYWGADETPTDTDSRTLSRSSLGESSELTGDSRSDTLSAESKGDRLSVCTADTDSSFDDHVFTGMVFENRTYQSLQSRPPGDGGGPPAHPRSPAPGPPSSEAAAAPAIASIVFENSARKERERPVKIPSLIFGNSSLRTEGALPGNHCRESSGNSSSDVEADVEADEEDEEEEEEEDDEEEEDADSQEDNPSRHSSKRPSTSSVESASALRVPALEETFGELQGVKTFLEELQDRTPTAERLPVFVGPELHRAGSGGLGAVVVGGAEASPSSSSSALWCRRSRMSPAVTERTESDLDASEHRDDISSTGESMYADDEDEGQDFFADDPGSEVMVGCGASYYSAPEGGDGEGDNFWAECSSTTVEDTYQELETSMDAASSVFRNARRQMHDIHEHLQDLRRQMELLQDDVQHARIKVSSDMDSSDFQPALE